MASPTGSSSGHSHTQSIPPMTPISNTTSDVGYGGLLGNRRAPSVSFSPISALSRSPSSASLSSMSMSPVSAFPAFKEKEKEKGGLSPILPSHFSSLKEKRRFSLTKPWLTLLTVFALTATFALLSFLGAPQGTDPSSLLLSPFSHTAAFFGSRRCEPYLSFGSLSVNHTNAESNRWVPFDKKCKAPELLAGMRRGDVKMEKWAANKTVLVMGDRVSQEHVEKFCEFMGETAQVVRPGHPFFSLRRINRNPIAAGRSLGRRSEQTDITLPRICHIPRYNFMIVSAFHYGLDLQDYWAGSPLYTAPGLFEHRLQDIVAPLIAKIRASGRPTAPDLIEMSSGAFDLARWAKQDIAQSAGTEGGLSEERVTWYRYRVGQVLERLRRTFPDAKTKLWRSMHFPTDQRDELAYFLGGDHAEVSDAGKESAYFSLNRVAQLDQAVRSLVLSSAISDAPSGLPLSPVTRVDGESSRTAPHSDYRYNPWASLLIGEQAHSSLRTAADGDGAPTPGGISGAYIWGNIILYELWKSEESNRFSSRKM